MADDTANQPPRDVLSSLPHSRPQRRSARRDSQARPARPKVAAQKPSKATGTAPPNRAASKPRRRAPAKPVRKARAKVSGPTRSKARSSAAVTTPTAGARELLVQGPRLEGRRPASKAKRKATRSTRAAHRTAGRAAQPVPAAPAAQRDAGTRARGASVQPPSAPEIIGAAMQSAGELAQLGLKAGSQLLRSAATRLPRP